MCLSSRVAVREFDSQEALYKLLYLLLVASEACGGELYFGLLDLFALPMTAILLLLVLLRRRRRRPNIVVTTRWLKVLPDAQLFKVVPCFWPIFGLLRHVKDGGKQTLTDVLRDVHEIKAMNHAE